MTTYYGFTGGQKWRALQYDGTNTSAILSAVNATQPNGWTGNTASDAPGHVADDGSGNLTVTGRTGPGGDAGGPTTPSVVVGPVPVDWWVVWASDGPTTEFCLAVSDTNFPLMFGELT